jgi:hypothetical protein
MSVVILQEPPTQDWIALKQWIGRDAPDIECDQRISVSAIRLPRAVKSSDRRLEFSSLFLFDGGMTCR